MKHPISALSLMIGGLMLMPASQASESWFEVELIIFERVGESTKQQFKDPLKQFSAMKSIDIVDNAFYGVTKPCPVLSQFERFSLTPLPALNTQIDSIEPVLDTPALTNDEQTTKLIAPPEKTIVECIAPDDSLLTEAFNIRAIRQQERLSLDSVKDNSVISAQTSDTLSLAQQLTSGNPALVTPPLEEEDTTVNSSDVSNDLVKPEELDVIAPTYNPDIYVAYPQTFDFNGVSYQSIPAAERKYQTPLTVFQTIEQLPQDAASGLTKEEPDDAQPALVHTPESPYLLDQSRLEMTELVKKMRWQKSTKPIMHIGWRQPTLARHLAKPIHLFAGEDFSNQYNEQGQDKARLLAEADALAESKMLEQTDMVATTVEQAVDKLPNEVETINQPLPAINIQEIVAELAQDETTDTKPLWRFDGFLKIYLNHYLFIETDFDLRKIEQVEQQIAADDVDNLSNDTVVMTTESQASNMLEYAQKRTRLVNQLTSHPMKQHRRVRSKEIHYFDHSTMGMIIQIRRFKIPEPITEIAPE
ncbi:CsiV family protein [Psychrobium sp. nBUS_13]|uniref:CsiV family protein n=1 Tax=Psychrobium sp. nBUS_13 TaxID=3395319 RepID=UPI003EB755A4